MTYSDNTSARRSVPELFGSVFRQLAELMRTEGMLARTEMSEKMSHMGTGLGLLVGGAVLAMPALVILMSAAVAALIENGMAPSWASLLVGGVSLLLGLLLLSLGANWLRAGNLIPDKTLQQLQYDANAARNASNQVRSNYAEKRAA
jgi:Putative Actinobacterial Holin-X, holin superfamily III